MTRSAKPLAGGFIDVAEGAAPLEGAHIIPHDLCQTDSRGALVSDTPFSRLMTLLIPGSLAQHNTSCASFISLTRILEIC